ncbi:SRSF protein kinase 3-like [Falco rusticolus]|uniref:SRSF protein kinase 3-like n=1 Tax=Falco peregrinus TaxID=8954 RepID=UPI000679D354|nr:SRSF protein kinase 3-like [Falco peregrinus]XP_037242376.1 SRSF protein kinase 3-like [Falco rusticolus]XP_055565589.1 SRSF protein kinase 3-like [Falco cherrug]
MEEQVQEEMPAAHCTGGHHPMREGDVFNMQYQALRKLGCGAFATVWLCQDVRRKKQVAVKVLKSREGFAEAAKDEVALLRCVSSMKKKDQAGENIVSLLDDFRMIGENGFHACLVFEALGPSLRCLMGNYTAQGLPLPFVKKSLQQVLAGLHFLHKCCRIIHADIKPENILLYGHDKSLQRLLPDTLDCSQRTDLRLKGPGGDLGDRLEESDLMSIEVKIADLGSACWTYKPFSKKIQTQPYRALEVLLGLDYGTPADIWSTGCLAFEMATGECLFDPQPGKYFSRDDDHVARIIELLGRIPPQIAFSWNKSTKFFSRPGALLRLSRLSPRSLHSTLADRHRWRQHEVTPFASFLLPALQYAPQRRATAAQCLQHAWLSAP